jgi:hypothetical protein
MQLAGKTRPQGATASPRSTLGQQQRAPAGLGSLVMVQAAVASHQSAPGLGGAAGARTAAHHHGDRGALLQQAIRTESETYA